MFYLRTELNLERSHEVLSKKQIRWNSGHKFKDISSNFIKFYAERRNCFHTSAYAQPNNVRLSLNVIDYIFE